MFCYAIIQTSQFFMILFIHTRIIKNGAYMVMYYQFLILKPIDEQLSC